MVGSPVLVPTTEVPPLNTGAPPLTLVAPPPTTGEARHPIMLT